MLRMPLLSARRPHQKFSRPRPMQVSGPIPVMTARRRGVSLGRMIFLKVSLHEMQGLVCHWADEPTPYDWFDNRCQKWNPQSKIIDELQQTAGLQCKSRT